MFALYELGESKDFCPENKFQNMFFAPDFMPDTIKCTSRCFQKFQFNSEAFWLDSPDFL